MGTMLLSAIYRSVEHMSTAKAATLGGAGTGISLTAAMIDPSALSPWLHLVTLAIGSPTGLASLVLVGLKIVQQYRVMKAKP